MWTYSTNVMGPYGLWWYKQNNIPYEDIPFDSETFGKGTHRSYDNWFGGRIDCRCSNTKDKDYDPFGQELTLPIMTPDSLYNLDKWLKSYKSETFNVNLLETFEEETKTKLECFVEGMYLEEDK